MSTKINLYKQSGTDVDTRVNFNVPRSLTYGLNARANDDGGVSESDNCTYNTLNDLVPILNSASLVVTPSSYKEGKLYSVIPSDGSGDFTFTRATTATRVNSAGLVELVPYNLLSYSEQFDNVAWNKVGAGGAIAPVVTANAGTAPDGTLTAERVQFDCVGTTSTFRSLIGQGNISTVINSRYTQSIYVKAFSPSEVGKQLRIVSEGTNNGSIITITADWQRITINGIPTIFTNSNFNIETRGSFTTNTTADVLLWGAQLVQGTNALPYQKTETRLNIPRLDYSNGTCPSLLVEPQRTNLIQRSQEFDNVEWATLNATITANTTISPSGVQDADRIQITNALSNYINNGSASPLTNGATYTVSCYVRSFGATNQNFRLYANSNQSSSTLTATPTWQRFEYTFTATSTSVGCGITSPSISDIVVWGYQHEAGSYATSYIPTTTASVTRNVDIASKTGISSLIGQTEGTIFLDIVFKNPISSINRPISITETVWSSGGSIRLEVTSSQFVADIVNAGASVGAITYLTSVLPNTRYKIAIAYKQNDCKMYINGVQVGSDITTGVMPTCSELYLNNLGGTFSGPYEANAFNSVILFKEALTDEQCSILTSDSYPTAAAAYASLGLVSESPSCLTSTTTF